jgi:hypothetical protein
MKDNSKTISLSLVSHTNVGKTTLARTLLSRNVGVVKDEPHVTDSADRFVLLETPEGDVLSLWDTPGFGDSSRLADRLQKSERPIGWFVSQVWDRLTDRALWSSQQAVRNAREEADVVLYLVNAAENPEDAGYVEPEMRILQWIGKPIIVLVNQMGPPSGPAHEAEEIERWRAHLSYAPAVRQVLALDAFARCWVQEGALLKEVAHLLPDDKRVPFGRLHRAWQTQRREAFDAAMKVLAARLARAALDKEKVAHGGIKGRLRDVSTALGVTRDKENSAKQKAMRDLAERLNQDIHESTNRLIELHGLEGTAGDEVLTRLADHYAVTKQVNEGRAAVVGGLVTGALAGLKADVITGGFTLGGGMIAGGVLGALGAAGLARGYNMVRGTETVTVTWTDEVMNRLVASSLLAYLMKGLTAAVQTELTLAAERVLIRLYPEAVSAAAIGTENTRLSAEARADAQRLQAAQALEAERQAEQARREAAAQPAAQDVKEPAQDAREPAQDSAAPAPQARSEAPSEATPQGPSQGQAQAQAQQADRQAGEVKAAPLAQAADKASAGAPSVEIPRGDAAPGQIRRGATGEPARVATPPVALPGAVEGKARLPASFAAPDAAPDGAHKPVPPAATRAPKRNARTVRRRRMRRAADGADASAPPPNGAARSSS